MGIGGKERFKKEKVRGRSRRDEKRRVSCDLKGEGVMEDLRNRAPTQQVMFSPDGVSRNQYPITPVLHSLVHLTLLSLHGSTAVSPWESLTPYSQPGNTNPRRFVCGQP